jgi:Xaa-Pro aminopeptidase
MIGTSRPFNGFPPEVFARRRERILERMGDGALVLPAAPILRKSRDTEHRYRPDSELFYATGITESMTVAVLRGFAQEEPFVLFAPEPDPKHELWFGSRLGLEELADVFGAGAAYPLSQLEEKLPDLLEGADRIFFRIGSDARCQALVFAALERARNRGPRKGEGPRGVLDPGEVLDELRIVKEEEEIARLRQAAQVTSAGFVETIPLVRPGMGEWEVEGLLESAFRRAGARGPAFPTIVGSGVNGCILHYPQNHRVIEDGELVLIDGGADVDLYAADVSRTFPANGSFSSRQRDVYQVVLEALRTGVDAVRPGTEVTALHHTVVSVLTRGLVELGVLAGDPEELRESKAYEPFFPHQTSHWLGLDVHDVGDYMTAGEPIILEPGMVVTIEPGLYFREVEGQEDSPFIGTGVRLEDDVLVTEAGPENLTASIPTAPDAVEALMATG